MLLCMKTDLGAAWSAAHIRPVLLVIHVIGKPGETENGRNQSKRSAGRGKAFLPGFSITQRQCHRARGIQRSSRYAAFIVGAMRNNSKDDGCSTLRHNTIIGGKRSARCQQEQNSLPFPRLYWRGSIIKALFLLLGLIIAR